jgi:hypothetical protein
VHPTPPETALVRRPRGVIALAPFERRDDAAGVLLDRQSGEDARVERLHDHDEIARTEPSIDKLGQRFAADRRSRRV